MWFWIWIVLGVGILGVILWLLRHFLLFALGVTAVVVGVAMAFVGVALLIGQMGWLSGVGLTIGGILVGAVGWELIQKANRIGAPPPSVYSGSQAGSQYTSHPGRRNRPGAGSSFGAGF